ncbi:MAG: DUF3108 domain-containing protein [Gemmatimonadales bacterium]
MTPIVRGTTLAMLAPLAVLGSPNREPEGRGAVTGAPSTVAAQTAPDTLEAWHFPVGERMEYSVTWGGARIGKSVMRVEAIDTISGVPAYRASLETEGGPPFYRLHDKLTSWIQPAPFATLRFDQRLRQGGYHRDRRHVMDLRALTYTRYDLRDGRFEANEEESDVSIPPGALDDVSYFYFARLSALEVGARYEYERYFKEDSNPVILEVLRRERIRVPAGTFNTIVVRPIIKTGGMFAEGGEAELFLTDDDRRIPVRVKTRMSIGTANFYLTEYDPGTPGALIPADAPAIEPGSSVADSTPADSTAAPGVGP